MASRKQPTSQLPQLSYVYTAHPCVGCFADYVEAIFITVGLDYWNISLTISPLLTTIRSSTINQQESNQSNEDRIRAAVEAATLPLRNELRVLNDGTIVL